MGKSAKLSSVCSMWRLATSKLYIAVSMSFRLVISSAFLCQRRRQQSGMISIRIRSKNKSRKESFRILYRILFHVLQAYSETAGAD